MNQYINSITKFIDKHKAYLALVTTAMPFLVGFISALFFAKGDVRLINFFILEIGIVDFWLQGLVTIMTVASQLLLINFLLDLILKDKSKWKAHSFFFNLLISFVVGIGIVILPVSLLIGSLIGVVIGRIVVILLVKIYKKNNKNIQKIDMKPFLIIFGIFILYTSIVSYPNLPKTKLEMANGDTAKVEILAQKSTYYLVQTSEMKIIKVPKDNIVAETLCVDSRNDTLPGLITNRHILDNC